VIQVFAWSVRPGCWKVYAPDVGIGATASNRSEALRQFRGYLRSELDQWDRELKIVEGQPPGENE
jgi:hypothetical protein